MKKRQGLGRCFRIALPSGLLWERPNIAALSGFLTELLSASRPADAA